jgi:hypothetical protein
VIEGDKSFQERQKTPRIAENMFEVWCTDNGILFHRAGFDQTNEIKEFYRLNKVLRNIPDYVIQYPSGCMFAVAVKGTLSMKHEEMDFLDKMIECYSSTRCPLIYAFCIRDQEPKLYEANVVQQLFALSKIEGEWSDRKKYKVLCI